MQRHKSTRTLFRLTGTCSALMLALASCGGGDSASSTPTETGIQLSGTVVDGPIQGTTVFLDLNSNLAHDPEEPVSLPTNARGAFTITAKHLDPAQLDTVMFVTHVPSKAKDADDGGASLAEAGRYGFTMMTPAAAYLQTDARDPNQAAPVFLSPLTTFVAAEMAFNGLTLAEAKAAVQQHLNLQGKDPMTNFIAERDTALGNIARTAAISLGEAGNSIAAVAKQEGGMAMNEQVAFTVQAVKKQMPSLQANLNLYNTGSAAPSNDAVKSELAKPVYASVMTTVADETRRSADKFHDYVVVFKPTVGDPSGLANQLTSGRGGKIKFNYAHAIKGFAVSLPEAAAEAFVKAMEQNPNVDYVEADKPVVLSQTTQSNSPWGLDRADQRSLPLSGSYTYTRNGTGVNAYVVDTGILASHVDFGGRVSGGYTAISDGRGTTDCNGHGTHVAGTIGGATWGIAKGVKLVPVRVLDCAGSGTSSGVIAGIDWVVANAARPALINMSLGGTSSSATDSAVANAVAKGIPVVVAAGNDNANACNYSPAREPSAITVGATASSDERASYSSFGTCLDLFAPGSAIQSASHSSTTGSATMSGTSMASPHVAGLVAQLLQSSPSATPAQVTEMVKTAATTGKVTNAGSGSPNLLLYTNNETSTTTPPATNATVYVSSMTSSSALVWKGWRATARVVVKNADGVVVSGAVVKGDFSVGGTALSCTTSTNGSCSIRSNKISRSTASTKFTVSSISGTSMTYDAGRNVASSITIYRP